MEKSFIYTENMTVGYDGKALIRDIRLSLEKGQILTLIGPNGAAFFLQIPFLSVEKYRLYSAV